MLKAFGILTGDIEAEKVKGLVEVHCGRNFRFVFLYYMIFYIFFNSYCPSLYEGLKPCPLHKHVHVPGDVDFLTVLLEKAEHELSGM